MEVPGTLKVEWVDECGVPLDLGPVLPPGVTWESAREPAQGRALPSPEHDGRCDQLSPAPVHLFTTRTLPDNSAECLKCKKLHPDNCASLRRDDPSVGSLLGVAPLVGGRGWRPSAPWGC